MKSFLMNPARRDHWGAVLATAAFIVAWFLSPTGDFVTSLAVQVKPTLSGWAFPIAGITVFWASRLFLMLWRMRGEGKGPLETKRYAEAKDIVQSDKRIFRYWLIKEPGRLDVYVYGCQQDIEEYCQVGDRQFFLISNERIHEIGEEWLYDRVSSRLIRRDDGSLQIGSPWDAVVASSKPRSQSQ
jgi:hypothetical protein